jgi:hypothetical protein
MLLRSIASLACTAVLATATLAQNAPADHNMGDMKMAQPTTKSMPSPPATASVSLKGKDITIKYNAPSVRGRQIMGALVPYDKVWRTGANPATTLITAANLKIGTLEVPAGTYTIYTLPNPDTWMLIINKQTGQWGTIYNQDRDLGRTPMQGKTLPTSQEVMSISFENTKAGSTELHIKWDTTDRYVTITAQ